MYAIFDVSSFVLNLKHENEECPESTAINQLFVSNNFPLQSLQHVQYLLLKTGARAAHFRRRLGSYWGD